MSDQLTEIRPVLEDSKDEVMSYIEYLDRILPLKSAEEIPDPKERARANADHDF